MEIKVVQDAKSIEADILVVNKFEDENTSNELANKYAVEQDNFKGKFGETYLYLLMERKSTEKSSCLVSVKNLNLTLIK